MSKPLYTEDVNGNLNENNIKRLIHAKETIFNEAKYKSLNEFIDDFDKNSGTKLSDSNKLKIKNNFSMIDQLGGIEDAQIKRILEK